MRVTGLMNRAKAVAATEVPEPPREGNVRWYLIESRILGDRFVYCLDRKALRELKAEFPDTAIYFPPEMAELIALEETLTRDEWLELVGAVHRLKKRFRGWVVPKGRSDGVRA